MTNKIRFHNADADAEEFRHAVALVRKMAEDGYAGGAWCSHYATAVTGLLALAGEPILDGLPLGFSPEQGKYDAVHTLGGRVLDTADALLTLPPDDKNQAAFESFWAEFRSALKKTMWVKSEESPAP